MHTYSDPSASAVLHSSVDADCYYPHPSPQDLFLETSPASPHYSFYSADYQGIHPTWLNTDLHKANRLPLPSQYKEDHFSGVFEHPASQFLHCRPQRFDSPEGSATTLASSEEMFGSPAADSYTERTHGDLDSSRSERAYSAYTPCSETHELVQPIHYMVPHQMNIEPPSAHNADDVQDQAGFEADEEAEYEIDHELDGRNQKDLFASGVSSTESVYTPVVDDGSKSEPRNAPARKKTNAVTRKTTSAQRGVSRRRRNVAASALTPSQPKKKASKAKNGAGTLEFHCSFHHYGCSKTFPRMNDWKRHINTMHFSLKTYKCYEPSCVNNNKTFKREDLFKQHHIRMHFPGDLDPNNDDDKEEFSQRLKANDVYKKSTIQVRDLPARTTCPEHNLVFTDWSKRMDHFGQHYEKPGSLAEPEDPELRKYALDEDIIKQGKGGRYVLTEQKQRKR